MITHRILQWIPKTISEAAKTVENNSELVDRNIANLAVPTTCAALFRSYIVTPGSHFIDFLAKATPLAALNEMMIKPGIVYISPTKRFFDTLNHPITQTAKSAISNSLPVQFIVKHPLTMLCGFITKISLARLLTENVAEPIQNYIPENYYPTLFPTFAIVTLGSFLKADLFSSPKTPIATLLSNESKELTALNVEKASDDLIEAEPIEELPKEK